MADNPDLAEVEDLKARYRAGTVGDVEVKTKLASAMKNARYVAEFLAEQRVEVTASLPCYLEDNVDAQRFYRRLGATLRRKVIAFWQP